MRPIDADKIHPNCLSPEGKVAIYQSQLADALTLNVIAIPENATNGDIAEIIFGKDAYYRLLRNIYSVNAKKMTDWWDAPYKKGE